MDFHWILMTTCEVGPVVVLLVLQMKTLAGRLSLDYHQLVMQSSESRLRKAVFSSTLSY